MESASFWVSGLALLISVLGCLWSAVRGASAHRHNGTERRLRDLEAAHIETLDWMDKTQGLLKRKYQRDYARNQRKKESEPELSDADWKKQMALKYATKQWSPN